MVNKENHSKFTVTTLPSAGTTRFRFNGYDLSP